MRSRGSIALWAWLNEKKVHVSTFAILAAHMAGALAVAGRVKRLAPGIS